MIESVTVENIHFEYSEGFLPTPRCRKIRYRKADGITSAEVVLLTEPDEDAPIAFRVDDWRLTSAMGHEYYGDEKQREAKEIRLFNGKLYERDHMGNHVCGGIGWYNMDDFIRDFVDFRCSYSYELGKRPDTLEEYMEAIRLHAKSVILMKNKEDVGVWIECGEPRYVYNLFGLGHNHGGTGLFVEQYYNSNIPNTHYFNALHREEAINAAIAAALRRGDDLSVESIKMCENIEVLIPSAVKVDPMKQHGEGDDFINMLNSVVECTSSATEASVLVMAFTAKEIAGEKE